MKAHLFALVFWAFVLGYLAFSACATGPTVPPLPQPTCDLCPQVAHDAGVDFVAVQDALKRIYAERFEDFVWRDDPFLKLLEKRT